MSTARTDAEHMDAEHMDAERMGAEHMDAVREQEHGGPEVLVPSRIPVPACAPEEVVLDVVAAGINRADVQQRRGKYPVPPGASDVYGLEVSGTVRELGAGAAAEGRLSVGQPVVALLAGGGYAQRVAVPAGQVVPAPEGIGLVEAAGLPEVAATVWSNLIDVAGLDPQGPPAPAGMGLAGTAAAGTGPEGTAVPAVLVHGGTGGIGAHAVQLLRALGYGVVTTVGSAEKAAWVRQMLERQDSALAAVGRAPAPAAVVVDYREEDFVAAVQRATDGKGVRAVLDVVGGSYLERNVECLGTGGHLVTIAVQGGRSGTLDLAALMKKRASVSGTTLRGRPVAEKARILADAAARVWPLVACGVVDPLVDRVFPLAEVRRAHEYFDSGRHRGKVLLRP